MESLINSLYLSYWGQPIIWSKTIVTQRKMNRKKVFWSAKKCVLDALLSLYMYFFLPKVLLKDQKMLNLRRIEMIKEGLLTFVLVWRISANRRKQKYWFLWKICFKVCLEIFIFYWNRYFSHCVSTHYGHNMSSSLLE